VVHKGKAHISKRVVGGEAGKGNSLISLAERLLLLLLSRFTV
jgi:hypothetical protein